MTEGENTTFVANSEFNSIATETEILGAIKRKVWYKPKRSLCTHKTHK